MKESGNPTQWGDSYPPRKMVEDDIRLGRSSVVTENGVVCGVFVFLIGNDPTYAVIEDGTWLNDAPYGVVHRAAGSPNHRGILNSIMAYCEAQVDNLRVDTHSNNHTMHHLLQKLGFQTCGTIYADDGTPRIAYQKIIR